MPKLKVRNLENKEIGEIELSDRVFGTEVKPHLLQEVVRVAGGQEIVLEVELDGAPPKPAPGAKETTAVDAQEQAAAQPEDAPDKKSWKHRKSPRIWTWVAYGLGGAAAVGAVVTGVLALTKDNEIWEQCGDDICFSHQYDGDYQADADTVNTLALTTDILIGVGAAAVVAGTLLYFFEPDYAEERQVTVHPTMHTNGAGLGVTGRF